jgi:hypothetical protein
MEQTWTNHANEGDEMNDDELRELEELEREERKIYEELLQICGNEEEVREMVENIEKKLVGK